MTAAPPNLDVLRHIPDPVERAVKALAYIAERKNALTEARRIRDDAIETLLHQGTDIPAIAAAVGMSIGHIKLVKRIAEARA